MLGHIKRELCWHPPVALRGARFLFWVLRDARGGSQRFPITPFSAVRTHILLQGFYTRDTHRCILGTFLTVFSVWIVALSQFELHPVFPNRLSGQDVPAVFISPMTNQFYRGVSPFSEHCIICSIAKRTIAHCFCVFSLPFAPQILVCDGNRQTCKDLSHQLIQTTPFEQDLPQQKKHWQ